MKTNSNIFVTFLLFGAGATISDCRAEESHASEAGVKDAVVGLAISPDSSAGISTVTSGVSSTVEGDLVETLEGDEQVTVVGEILLGELLCESLEDAGEADTLAFAISVDETIQAQKTSFTTLDGASFSDGITRKVWEGVDVDNTLRTVSMTWGDPCDVETFLLQITTMSDGDLISVLKSVPCEAGTSDELCLVEVELDLKKADDPDESTTSSDIATGDKSRRLRKTTARRRAKERSSPVSQGRGLQTATQIDIMLLFTQGARVLLGDISDAQMESNLAAAIVSSNEGLANSEVNLVLNLVYVGALPYEEDAYETSEALYTLQSDADVAALRDEYAADLVQMIGGSMSGCGRAFLFTGLDTAGFGVTAVNCISGYTHTHEFGHNMGCYHNRDDSSTSTDYAHGYRYCDGVDPYRTLMSYYCGSPRINYFSNPDVSVFDKPTGTSTEDNARAIEDNMEAIAAFRTAVSPPTPAPPTPAPPTPAPPTPAPPTPAPTTPAPTSAPTIPGLVDASVRTTVSVRANAYDSSDGSTNGCDPDGCVASNTRDSDLNDTSRWSCDYDIENKLCRLTFGFGNAQDVKDVKIAFYKGDERTRRFKVKTWNSDNDRNWNTFTSDGETDGFETFSLNSEETVKLQIFPTSPNKYDWFSLNEVQIMVE